MCHRSAHRFHRTHSTQPDCRLRQRERAVWLPPCWAALAVDGVALSAPLAARQAGRAAADGGEGSDCTQLINKTGSELSLLGGPCQGSGSGTWTSSAECVRLGFSEKRLNSYEPFQLQDTWVGAGGLCLELTAAAVRRQNAESRPGLLSNRTWEFPGELTEMQDPRPPPDPSLQHEQQPRAPGPQAVL